MHRSPCAPRPRGFAAAAALLAFGGLLASSARVGSAALASASGGSGYSGVLSSDSATRHQQLICDPTGAPLSGMTSVKYDASVVSLNALDFAPGYTGSGAVEVKGLVPVKQPNGCWVKQVKTFLQPLSSFLQCPQGTQTGYVQVYYKEVGTPQEMCPPKGYQVVDASGVNGTDTHDLIFSYLSCAKNTATANYTIYADPGNRASGNGTDFLTGVTPAGKVFTLGPSQIAPASVSGSLVSGPKKGGKGGKGEGDDEDDRDAKGVKVHASLVRATTFAGIAPAAPSAVPLPPALWTGMATLAGLGLAGLRRRVRAG